jgi:formylglycine-generating enzyme required for sulfatase activity
MTSTFTLPLLEWCDIPAGWVMIEEKEHSIEAFRISKYPVTYAQFQAFIDAPDGFRNDECWQGLAERETEPGKQEWPVDNHPRENVSWYDAVAFCRWLSDKTGLAISLPTEQQWQRAAQGDDEREYPWGSGLDPRRCNTSENDLKRTTPVDQYPDGVSPYGAHDMAGNVWEWCLNESDNPENTGLAGSAIRVLRGGSWYSAPERARCTARYRDQPDARFGDFGFRVVCGL